MDLLHSRTDYISLTFFHLTWRVLHNTEFDSQGVKWKRGHWSDPQKWPFSRNLDRTHCNHYLFLVKFQILGHSVYLEGKCIHSAREQPRYWCCLESINPKALFFPADVFINALFSPSEAGFLYRTTFLLLLDYYGSGMWWNEICPRKASGEAWILQKNIWGSRPTKLRWITTMQKGKIFQHCFSILKDFGFLLRFPHLLPVKEAL